MYHDPHKVTFRETWARLGNDKYEYILEVKYYGLNWMEIRREIRGDTIPFRLLKVG